MEINYSFIIPHKNCPDLLNRCLDSIPQREDIQIIVVDDNSDDGKKPSVNRKDVEVVLLDAEHSKGAGRARNVGLEKATGKWLLFADSDDYYVDNFLSVIDSYRNNCEDIIFFTSKAVMSDTLKPVKSRTAQIEMFIKTGNFKRLRYQNYVPWAKMIRGSLVRENNIKFDEVEVANDMMFSLKTGYYAKSVLGVLKPIYVSAVRSDSLWFRTTEKRIEIRYSVLIRINDELIKMGEWRMKPNLLKSVRQFKQFSDESYRRHLKDVWKEEPWYAYLFDLIRLMK